ncbi:MAG: hypothetical protein DRP18_05245, partial [Candidatus Aenigmatarchaeota archaeon]
MNFNKSKDSLSVFVFRIISYARQDKFTKQVTCFQQKFNHVMKNLSKIIVFLLFLQLVSMPFIVEGIKYYDVQYLRSCSSSERDCSSIDVGGSACNVYRSNSPESWLTRYSVDSGRTPFALSDEEKHHGNCLIPLPPFPYSAIAGEEAEEWLNKGIYLHKHRNEVVTIYRYDDSHKPGRKMFGGYGGWCCTPDDNCYDINNNHQKYGRHLTKTTVL